MSELIKFLPSYFIGNFDEDDFRSKDDFKSKYAFPDWYKFCHTFATRQPPEPRDRTGNLTSPYKIDSDYTSPIPTDLSNTKTISECMESKALELEKSVGDKYLDIFLTGGFDSTVMYAAFLKVCDNSKVRVVFQYSEDAEYHQSLNQNNTELYKYIIDNKLNYRLLDLTSTIHTDDSISVLGHPGNFVSNKKYLLSGGGPSQWRTGNWSGRNESLIPVENDIVDGKYDGESWEKLITAIEEIFEKNGSVLIPTFALGRTQEILSILALQMKSGRLKKQPVFIGGLGRVFTEIYDLQSHRANRQHTNLQLDEELDLSVLSRDQAERIKLNKSRLFVMTAGMLTENTTAYDLAKRMIEQPEHGIFFVGYADPETPGGRLKAAKHGEQFHYCDATGNLNKRCKVRDFDFTAHANREELLELVGQVSPKTLILGHGETQSRDWSSFPSAHEARDGR